MVDDILLREAWRGAVTATASDLSFYSYWTPELDEGPDDSFPAVVWGAVDSAVEFPRPAQLRESFTCRLSVFRKMGSDRSRDDRDQAVAEMRAVARGVLVKFWQLYVRGNGTVNGAALDLSFTGQARFLPVYDEGPHGYTGVEMEITVVDNVSNPC